MSEPSSWAMEDDSPVCATSASRCGRAMSHSPSDDTYAIPRPSTFGVSVKVLSLTRTYPSSASVSSRRRAVGRARPAATATSLRVIVGRSAPKQDSTSSPRARASTKSGPVPRPAISGRRRFSEDRLPLLPGRRRAELGVGVRVVEHLVIGRQLRVHPSLPDVLVHVGAQVVHRRGHSATGLLQIHPDQPVLVL